MRAVPGLVQVELIVQGLLPRKGRMATRQLRSGLPSLSSTSAGKRRWLMVVVHGQADLLEVVDALGPSARPHGPPERPAAVAATSTPPTAGEETLGERFAGDDPDSLHVGYDRERAGEQQGCQLNSPWTSSGSTAEGLLRQAGGRTGVAGSGRIDDLSAVSGDQVPKPVRVHRIGMKRTEPSAKAALNPPSWGPPTPWSA